MGKREDFPPDQRKAPVSPPTPPPEVIPVEELVSDADPTLEWSISDLASDASGRGPRTPVPEVVGDGSVDIAAEPVFQWTELSRANLPGPPTPPPMVARRETPPPIPVVSHTRDNGAPPRHPTPERGAVPEAPPDDLPPATENSDEVLLILDPPPLPEPPAAENHRDHAAAGARPAAGEATQPPAGAGRSLAVADLAAGHPRRAGGQRPGSVARGALAASAQEASAPLVRGGLRRGLPAHAAVHDGGADACARSASSRTRSLRPPTVTSWTSPAATGATPSSCPSAACAVTGLDLSLPLLIRAADESQRRALSVNFVHADMREMAFDSQFDGAYCVLSSFGYFDEETNLKVATSICRALKPGGRFLLDTLNRDYIVSDLPTRVWWEGDGCVVLEEVDFNFHTSRGDHPPVRGVPGRPADGAGHLHPGLQPPRAGEDVASGRIPGPGRFRQSGDQGSLFRGHLSQHHHGVRASSGLTLVLPRNRSNVCPGALQACPMLEDSTGIVAARLNSAAHETDDGVEASILQRVPGETRNISDLGGVLAMRLASARSWEMDAMDRTVVKSKGITRRPRPSGAELRRDKSARRPRTGRASAKADRAASPQPANDQVGEPEMAAPEFEAIEAMADVPMTLEGTPDVPLGEDLELDVAPASTADDLADADDDEDEEPVAARGETSEREASDEEESEAAPAERREEEPQSFLAMYFRDMAELEVLRPEQEFETARNIEDLELDLWRTPAGLRARLGLAVGDRREDDRQAVPGVQELPGSGRAHPPQDRRGGGA
jgi:SAM-dependent methyltransferase